MSLSPNTDITPSGHELLPPVTVAGRGPRRGRRAAIILRRVFSNRGAGFGVVVLVVLFLFAFVGPLVSGWTYSELDYTALRQPPNGEHWFGTNNIGQDVFTQTARGMQKSLLIGLLVALFSTGLAGFLGAAAGYFGGLTDRIIMFAVDALLVLPAFLIIAILSPRLKTYGWVVLVVLLAAFSWMVTARVIRSMTLSIKEREYVRAAQYMGIGDFTIIVRHILPNVASFLIIDATIAVGGAVLGEASLSYFGFGVQSPDVSLGTLIAQNQGAALTSPWLFFYSAVALILFALAANLLGDGLRDAFDPTSRAGKRIKREKREGRRRAKDSDSLLIDAAGAR